MPKYINKNSYHSRRKKLIFRRIRFIIILLLLIIAVVLFVKMIKSPSYLPSDAVPIPTISQTASPAPITQPTDSATPDVSATPADIIPTTAPSIDLLKTLQNKDGIKTAYLTFDDGPTNSITPLILDTLRKYNIKATFFQVGSLIESNPDIARRVYEEGHLIANHSYGHNYSEIYATEDGFISEIQSTETLIKNITGQEDIFKLFRYPGGSHNAGTWGAKKQAYKEALKNMGYVYADWNSLNGDAEGGVKTTQQLVDRVKETISGQEDVIILMHDSAAKKTTAQSLEDVIKLLISEGYTFARMDNKN